jgi:hypothetical protein
MNVKKWLIIFFITIIFFCISYPLHKILYIDGRLLKNHSGDIIYFADSILKSHSKCENKILGIDDIVRNNGLNIKNINQGAYSPIVYQNYIKNIKKQSTVIIPINMRSFSEEWFNKPSYQFFNKRMASSILAMDFISLYQLFIESFKYDKQIYNDTDIIRNGNDLGTIYSIAYSTKINEDLYCNDKTFYTNDKYIKKLLIKYKYHYMYKLTLNHKMFKYLKNIISFSRENNINLLFYITPINFEYGEIIVDKNFNIIVNNNINTLIKFFKDNNALYLDLSKKVDGKNFNDHQYVCEHLDYTGREIVASNIYNYFNR